MCIKKQCFTENFYIFLLCSFFYDTFSLFYHFFVYWILFSQHTTSSRFNLLLHSNLSLSSSTFSINSSRYIVLTSCTSNILQCHFKVNFKVTSIKFHFTLKHSSILPIPGKIDSVFRHSVIKKLTIYALNTLSKIGKLIDFSYLVFFH